MNLWVRCFLAVLSGVLGSLVFAPVGWGWLAVMAWVPLFGAIQGSSVAVGGRLGMLCGLVFYGFSMRWLMEVFAESAWMWGPLVFVMAAFGMLFGAGYAGAFRRYGCGWRVVLLGSAWWVGIEFVRGELWVLRFPWLSPGVGLGPTWVSPLLGVYGISFLVVMGGMLLFQGGRLRFWGAGVLVVMLVSSLWRPAADRPFKRGVRVLAVNVEEATVDELLEMARGGESAEFILFPEYAFGFDVRENPVVWEKLVKFSKERGAVLVFGTRTNVEDGWYNTSLAMVWETVLQTHYKNYPVHFFADGIAGTDAKAVKDYGVPRFGMPICFDCDYGDVVRRMTADGADFFLVPSLDGASWGSQEHFQHAELFRHRAAENGRWMMVAAGSGMAQLIDDHGNRVDSVAPMTVGILEGEMVARRDLTIYTRGGWVFPWVCLVVGGVWMGWIFVRWVFVERRG